MQRITSTSTASCEKAGAFVRPPPTLVLIQSHANLKGWGSKGMGWGGVPPELESTSGAGKSTKSPIKVQVVSPPTPTHTHCSPPIHKEGGGFCVSALQITMERESALRVPPRGLNVLVPNSAKDTERRAALVCIDSLGVSETFGTFLKLFPKLGNGSQRLGTVPKKLGTVPKCWEPFQNFGDRSQILGDSKIWEFRNSNLAAKTQVERSKGQGSRCN